jgi:NADH dehydrogenase/NADH:ubiquinone oxidoreductase subunit G
MKSITMEIDGKTVTASEGMMVLQVARQAGIEIPTLCYSELLKPSGVCRMCMVEIAKGKRRRLVASCCYPAEDGLVVATNTPKIHKIRRMIIELLWPAWGELAKQYGITKSRFVPRLTDCSLCGLCVRYCAEVAKKNALYFQGRGINRRPAFIPGIADCDSCRECFGLCTGGWIVAEHSRVSATLND